ncbi:MAG: hypothetical protein M1389_00460 [Chloroflexi bacterium]|nr:hypothetical protein [Chloroflexota bacterium]
METIRATIEWTPDIDRFVLWADDLAGSAFVPEPFGDLTDSLLLEVDEHGQETGRIVGVEMSLLSFDRWEDLSRLDVLWQLPGQEPLPLDKLLKRVQKELRQRKGREAA